MGRLPWLPAALPALALACAGVGGYAPERQPLVRRASEPVYAVDVSTGRARGAPPRAPAHPPAERDVRYYSDLGPDTIDVSAYPARQRHNYAVYSEACSRCHTLARSINAPMVSRGYWRLYLLGMRFNAGFRRVPGIAKDDQAAILDFLEYDSRVRKREHRAEFERRQDELLRRYRRIIDARMSGLQSQRRTLVPPEE